MPNCTATVDAEFQSPVSRGKSFHAKRQWENVVARAGEFQSPVSRGKSFHTFCRSSPVCRTKRVSIPCQSGQVIPPHRRFRLCARAWRGFQSPVSRGKSFHADRAALVAGLEAEGVSIPCQSGQVIPLPGNLATLPPGPGFNPLSVGASHSTINNLQA